MSATFGLEADPDRYGRSKSVKLGDGSTFGRPADGGRADVFMFGDNQAESTHMGNSYKGSAAATRTLISEQAVVLGPVRTPPA